MAAMLVQTICKDDVMSSLTATGNTEVLFIKEPANDLESYDLKDQSEWSACKRETPFHKY